MKHYNPSINKSMSDTFNLKGESTDEVYDEIVPCVSVFPKIDICRFGTATNAASATIYTTPTDKDFYLTSIILTCIKDVTSTSTSETIRATIEGVNQILASIASISLTVQSGQVDINFRIPIKIDRGTNITVQNSTNVANITSHGCIAGYTVEVIKNT